jgi:hypothetical protein
MNIYRESTNLYTVVSLEKRWTVLLGSEPADIQ